RAGERELLDLAPRDLARATVVEVRDLAQLAAVAAHGEQLGRLDQRVPREQDAIAGRVGRVAAARGDDRARHSGRRVDGEQAAVAQIVGGREQRFTVAGPRDRVDRAIPRVGERAHAAGGDVDDRDARAVRLV